MGELSMPTQGVGRSSLSPSTAVGTPLRICSPPVPTEEAPGGSAPRHILPTHRTPERGCPGTCRPSGRGKVPPASPCHPSQPREAAPLLRLFPGGAELLGLCLSVSAFGAMGAGPRPPPHPSYPQCQALHVPPPGRCPSPLPLPTLAFAHRARCLSVGPAPFCSAPT